MRKSKMKKNQRGIHEISGFYCLLSSPQELIYTRFFSSCIYYYFNWLLLHNVRSTLWWFRISRYNAASAERTEQASEKKSNKNIQQQEEIASRTFMVHFTHYDPLVCFALIIHIISFKFRSVLCAAYNLLFFFRFVLHV